MEGKSYNILTHLNKKSIYFHLHIQLIQDYSIGLGVFQILILFSGEKKKQKKRPLSKSRCFTIFNRKVFFLFFIFIINLICDVRVWDSDMGCKTDCLYLTFHFIKFFFSWRMENLNHICLIWKTKIVSII